MGGSADGISCHCRLSVGFRVGGVLEFFSKLFVLLFFVAIETDFFFSIILAVVGAVVATVVAVRALIAHLLSSVELEGRLGH